MKDGLEKRDKETDCDSWLHQVVTLSTLWGGWQLSVKRLGRVSTSKSEVMVPCWKTVICSLWVGSELLAQAKEFQYLRILGFFHKGQ